VRSNRRFAYATHNNKYLFTRTGPNLLLEYKFILFASDKAFHSVCTIQYYFYLPVCILLLVEASFRKTDLLKQPQSVLIKLGKKSHDKAGQMLFSVTYEYFYNSINSFTK
jgi:hypothetical protein